MPERLCAVLADHGALGRAAAASARALTNDPRLLVADAPTGNLDPRKADPVLELPVELTQAGKTVLAGTHERDMTRLADRVVTLSARAERGHDGVDSLAQLSRDRWIERGRTLLMVSPIAVRLLGVGAVLGGYAILTREMARQLPGQASASTGARARQRGGRGAHP